MDIDKVNAEQTYLEEVVDTIHNQYFTDINPNSPKQISKYLFDELDLQVPIGIGPKPGSTNAEVIDYLSKAYPYNDFLANLLDYRKAKKILSTYFRS